MIDKSDSHNFEDGFKSFYDEKITRGISNPFNSKKTRGSAFDEFDVGNKKESTSSVHEPYGRDDLITYQRYCHMYKNGELDNLCSSIPGCKIVDRGFDRSNWFVLIKKVDDTRIFLKENTSNGQNNGHYDPFCEEDQSNRRRISSSAISQPMPPSS